MRTRPYRSQTLLPYGTRGMFFVYSPLEKTCSATSIADFPRGVLELSYGLRRVWLGYALESRTPLTNSGDR